MRLARASAEAYSGPFDGKTVIRIAGLDLLATIEREGDEALVAFRGTASLQNWRIDLQAAMNGDGEHRGFVNAWVMLRAPVLKAVADLEAAGTPFKRVWFTGHSLGGALALLAAADYSDCLEAGCYTFGQPRVSAKPFGMKMSAYWRIVDKEDIVPNVPGLLMGYRHFGNLLFFPCLGVPMENPPWWVMWLSHAVGIYADLQRIRSGKLPDWIVIKEHLMTQYLNLISTMPANQPDTKLSPAS